MKQFTGLLGLLVAFGCAADVEMFVDPVDGPKADSAECLGAADDGAGVCRFTNGRFAPSSCCEPFVPDAENLDCAVVWVNADINNNLYEEGFGSIYDLDQDGYIQTDGDSMNVSVEYDGTEPVEMSIGQISFDTTNAEFMYTDETEETQGGGTEGRWVTTLDSLEGDMFELRVFAHNRLASLLYDDGTGARQYATLDCRGISQPDYDTYPVEVGPAEESHNCWIVDVNTDINASLFEEGFGSIFDVDLQYGESMTDGDSREVNFDFDSGDTSINMGQYSFGTTAGDTIVVVDEREENFQGRWEGMIRTTIEAGASGDSFEVWEFTNGIASLRYQEAGSSDFRWFATLDCRPEMTEPADL